MIFFIKGLTYGAALSVLVGPIFFALLQAGVERGTRVGLMLGAGVWLSDLLYILTVYFSLSWISTVAALPNFQLYLGLIGGVVLIVFGITNLLNRTVETKAADKAAAKNAGNGYFANFIKGFLINTINPFTVFFWLSMSAEVLSNTFKTGQALVFFSGILGMVIFTDFLKVILAKKIRHFLTPQHILYFRKIVGIVMIVGGIALIYKSSLV
jgi:threonine/homoserine/homoserine lactone efflux protein